MSENSSARTNVVADVMADSISGKTSLIPPGSIPVPCRVAPPSCAAVSSGPSFGPRWNQPTGVTTFFPERRSAATSSGFGSSGA
jgi:hypothetical protein